LYFFYCFKSSVVRNEGGAVVLLHGAIGSESIAFNEVYLARKIEDILATSQAIALTSNKNLLFSQSINIFLGIFIPDAFAKPF
jgi:hypothetical protein